MAMTEKPAKSLRIAIGPLVGEYGGATQHVRNIIRYSNYQMASIVPSRFSLYYSKSRSKAYVRAILRRLGLRNVDMYGLFLSKIYLPRFDIVHLHGHPYWPAIYLKPKHRHAKYIHTVHQIYLEEDCYSAEEWAAKKRVNELMFESCRSSDIVISVAKWQQGLLKKEGIYSIYIPNGVDIKACETVDPDRFRSRYRIYDEFYFFLGDIRWYKRPKLFLELARRMPERTFVMAGDSVSTENLKTRLGIPIPENVLCLGPLSHTDYMDALASCTVPILASKNDTCPTALLEAMACRKVVVAADNAGPKEIVTHGRDGFLFKPDNADDLYEKALQAWNHPEVGIDAYRRVKTEYDWGVIIKRLDALYMELHEE